MPADRPVNLSLPGLFAAMPVTAVASILHRLTGIVLFVGMLYLCYLLDLALGDEAGFARAAASVASPAGTVAVWAIISALGFHLVAGIKHLLLDFHLGDSFGSARAASWIAILLSILIAVAAALLLW